MSAEITPVGAFHGLLTELIEETECSLFEVIGVLEVVKSELTLASLAADEDEAEGEFESDGVVGE
jgi:hypothetical protein